MRKYKIGFSIIETVLTILIISVFLVLLIKMNYSVSKFNARYFNKYLIYTHCHNIIQIIKSDPEFYSHAEYYYNINNEKVHDITTPDNKRYYLNIYFDQYGNITYQANAFYYIYISLTKNDYTDYYDYYYYIRIHLSNVVSSQTVGGGVYLHYSKNK